MGIQIVHDSDGRNAGVFIPYHDWEELKKKHKELGLLEQKKQTIKF